MKCIIYINWTKPTTELLQAFDNGILLLVKSYLHIYSHFHSPKKELEVTLFNFRRWLFCRRRQFTLRDYFAVSCL